MHFAFAIVSMFPGGGLQRDCVEIARRVRKLGHEVTIFTSRKFGDRYAEDLPLRILNVRSYTNHRRQRAFSDEFHRVAASQQFDYLVGFDKLGGLDILYCSDRSMQARATRNPLLQLLPRYWEYVGLEQECFAPNRPTKILLLSETQYSEYWKCWTTEPNRLTVLPPTLTLARRMPEYRTDGTRAECRARLGLTAEDWVWIAVGVQPRTKGIDRTIWALRQFPDARLMIVGLDEHDARSTTIRRLAGWLGVAQRILWLGHREDVPVLMAAADLFVHPARYDTTGTVILEAVVNGLPVITTSSCGYAKHVSTAEAGLVVHEPFRQRSLVAALKAAHDPAAAARWSKSGGDYGKQPSLYEGTSRATDLIVASAIDAASARCGAQGSNQPH
jgi:UDP-glucose:(heptosyl)LPS alpha-1,3-glucosyltransferase